MASFGETLKRERELREISLRQIAEATKISIRYLEALEANQFEVLPGGLFNKGFIRAYSRFIGIDGEAMVNSYLEAVGPQPPGTGISLVRDMAAMHRPSEVPQKRAGPRPGPRPGDSSAERATKPAMTFATSRPAAGGAMAPGSPAATAGASSPVGAASTAGAVAAPGGVGATGSVAVTGGAAGGVSASGSVAASGSAAPAATWPRDFARSAPSTIDAIDKANRPGPPSSRALFWILSLVAAAGVLFLLVSILRPAPPAASLPAESPEPESGAPVVPSEGTEPVPQDAAQPPDGSSALLPDMSQPSHITLGALTSGPPAATPAPGMVASGNPLAAPAPTAARPTADRPTASATPRPRPEPTPRPERDALPPPLAGVASGPGERSGTAVLRDSGPMQVELLVSERTFVQIVCDGRVVVNRLMEAGEAEDARCDSVVRISASDAGAARVTVNGAPCLPLGDSGTKAYGYTIRVDDFARICARNERGSRGRR